MTPEILVEFIGELRAALGDRYRDDSATDEELRLYDRANEILLKAGYDTETKPITAEVLLEDEGDSEGPL